MKNIIIVSICLLSLVLCQMNSGSVNSTENNGNGLEEGPFRPGRENWGNRHRGNHSRNGRPCRGNRSREGRPERPRGGRWGNRPEGRPDGSRGRWGNRPEERTNMQGGNNFRPSNYTRQNYSYYSRNNNNGKGRRPCMVNSVMIHTLMHFPDAFGAKYVATYNTTCEAYKSNNSNIGCCINNYYLGKEDCRYLYIFSISLVVFIGCFLFFLCCCGLGCSVMCCMIRRKRREFHRRMESVRQRNPEGIAVGQNFAIPMTTTGNNIPQNLVLPTNSANSINSVNNNQGMIQQNQRIGNTNDFQQSYYHRIK